MEELEEAERQGPDMSAETAAAEAAAAKHELERVVGELVRKTSE